MNNKMKIITLRLMEFIQKHICNFNLRIILSQVYTLQPVRVVSKKRENGPDKKRSCHNVW